MDEAERAKRQREQLERYLAWVREEGGAEGPTHLSTWFKPHQQLRLHWLKEHCTGSIMELGCNWGYVLAYCGGDVGADWNERSIALARILSPEREFVVADIRHLPFEDGYVDTVLLADVLEHVPWEDAGRAIAEAQRVARKKVLVTVPNGDHDTPESTSMKHQWLADSRKQAHMHDWLNDDTWRVSAWTISTHFVMVETVRR